MEFVTPGAVYPGGIAGDIRSGPMTGDEQPTQTTISQIADETSVRANSVEELNLFRDSRIDRILTVFLGSDSDLAYSRASQPGQVNFASILDGKAIADMKTEPLDLSKLKVLPLAQRHSLTTVDGILIDPDSAAKPCSDRMTSQIQECADRIRDARKRGASVMLIYGAHLLRNGAARILEKMMAADWLTHLATNGAGTIHDWEYAWFGASTESVEMNVKDGTFGTWHETASNIHLAIMAGALDGLGYGRSMGRLIWEDGVTLPSQQELSQAISADPAHPLTAARADLLRAMIQQGWPAGRIAIDHRWKQASIIAQAYKHQIPVSVHPGIGYDIISNHSVFNGGSIGRAGEWDFKLFGGAVEALDGGVVLSVGSAIMGPQVFEKTASCVNNLRLQSGRQTVHGHSIYVVDLQDGGGWDWTQGEPPKTNAAYYLRFCKSYSRMGGSMHYLQCDNATFIHNLFQQLNSR